MYTLKTYHDNLLLIFFTSVFKPLEKCPFWASLIQLNTAFDLVSTHMYVIYAHALEGNTKEVYMVTWQMNECHDINRSIALFILTNS